MTFSKLIDISKINLEAKIFKYIFRTKYKYYYDINIINIISTNDKGADKNE